MIIDLNRLQMNNRKRKRKVNTESSSSKNHVHSTYDNKSNTANAQERIPNTIRAILGSTAKILTLPEFIRQYRPSLPHLNLQNPSEDDERIRQTWLSPSKSLTIKTNLRYTSCCESLPDLVNHIIWILLQERSKTNRNVLSVGYELSPDTREKNKLRPCPTMKPGVVCKNINDNVSFLKSSSYAKRLHHLMGDDMMRILLLHTSLFLPIDQTKENYVLLSGPLLQPWRLKEPLLQSKLWQWNLNVVVPRYTLFYNSSFVPKVGLPSSHILNKSGDVKKLMDSIFPRDKIMSSIQRHQATICTLVHRAHAKCDYSRLLNRYCPLPQFCNIKNESSPTALLPIVAISFTPSHGVISFLCAVLKKAFPMDFWGSRHNLNQVLHKIRVFVLLRRHEQFPHKILMDGIRVKDIRWLWNDRNGKAVKSDHEEATLRVRYMMLWVFRHYLIPLLSSIFYITESEFSSKLTLYYRKPVWSIFRSLSMKKLLVNQYSEISQNEAIARIQKQEMGFSRLRLLPKETGVRPLAMLQQRVFLDFEITSGMDNNARKHNNGNISYPRKKRRLKDMKFQSTNHILEKTFHVLKYERSEKPKTFGAGIYGLNDLMPILSDFLAKVRSENPSGDRKGLANGTQLYFASVDIKHCYDNINQAHMLSILSEILSHDDYLIQKHTVLHPLASVSRIGKKKLHNVGPSQKYVRFHDAVIDLSKDYCQSIFENTGGCASIMKDDVLKRLDEHLLSHLVLVDGRYGRRLLLQTQGIPQGSIISTLLCNFYYGQMEKRLLSGTGLVGDCSANSIGEKNGHHLLVRIVDDFLLISTNKLVSHNFVQCMANGDSQLGVRINEQKTLTNYSTKLKRVNGCEEVMEKGTKQDESGKEFFPWCGLLFDTSSGEVLVDYSRFGHRKAINGITIDRSCAEGTAFKNCMKSFVKPRCQTYLFDPKINSSRVVATNFYQMMLLSAVKTGEYLYTGLSGGVAKNPNFIIRCIDDLIGYAYGRINSCVSNNKAEGKEFLGKRECFYLSFDAFHFVLKTMVKQYSDFDCSTLLVILRQRMTRSLIRSTGDLSDVIQLSRKQFDLTTMLDWES